MRDSNTQVSSGREVSLAGSWQMRVDPEGRGWGAAWSDVAFSGDAALLPGTMDTNPRQPASSDADLRGFSTRHPFQGTVWYQREIVVPESWHGKHIELFFERCQWETSVWIDGHPIGSRNSLVAPHVYTLPEALQPGRHLLTVAVDNSNQKRGMTADAEDSTAHADLTTEVTIENKWNCGGHHTASHNWNGIIGRIELRAFDPIHVASLHVYPRLSDHSVGLRPTIRNIPETPLSATARIFCTRVCTAANDPSGECEWTLSLDGTTEQVFEQRLVLTGKTEPWDEFHPVLHRVALHLSAGSSASDCCVEFGLREIGRQANRLTINGHAVFLRGTLENFIFPITGHPPMDVAAWGKIFAIAGAYGLTLFRFHTCCPPEAAFVAADEMGFYLQVEVPGTSCPQKDEGPEVNEFLTAELTRILEHYGNHPSLLLVSMGNEQLIADAPEFVKRHQEVLARRVRFAQAKDPRHFYTSTTHPFTPGRPDDFFVSAWPVIDEDRIAAQRRSHQEGRPGNEISLCGIEWSGFGVIDTARFNTSEPETASDYSGCLEGLDRPLITHEGGQWAVYPDLREISRYHGAKRASNFELIRDHLQKRGLLEWAADFTRASGKLALALYKEEIESALRTAELSGFQLLDLHDYPGQGTSTVGILNAVWESKGLVTPRGFRSFCAPVVPLARLPKRVWTAGEKFVASVEVAHYGPDDIAGSDVTWQLQRADGLIVAQGAWTIPMIPRGGSTRVGSVGVDLDSAMSAERLILRVEVLGANVNSWDVWVFPDEGICDVPDGISVSTRWDEAARNVLRNGGRLLLLPSPEELRDPIPGTFTTAFWNVQMKRAQPAKTMGLLIDDAHPCLEGFPTEYHSDWQWWDLVMRSSALRLDKMPQALRPAVTVIDSFTENRRLAMVVEGRVGRGRLMLCSADLLNNLESRPAARQLRRCLLNYMAGPHFQPDVPVSEEQLETILIRKYASPA